MAPSEQLKRYRADARKAVGQVYVDWAKEQAWLQAEKARITSCLVSADCAMSDFVVSTHNMVIMRLLVVGSWRLTVVILGIWGCCC